MTMRDMFDHSRPVTCTVCEEILHWADDQESWVDFYGVGMCRESEDEEYFPHDLWQDAVII